MKLLEKTSSGTNAPLCAALAIGVALLLSACMASPQSLILGTWEVDGAPMKMTVEFHTNGTAAITMFGQTLHGTYKLSPDNELEWTMNGITTTGKASVTATELDVTDQANQTIKYKRK
jgi:hypothetical protein